MTDNMLLRVKGVSKTFPGVKALDKVDFELKGGSVHAVCGENGAGKSTLMNILIGMYRRDEGEIYFKNKLVDFTLPKQALDTGISIIAQELNPIPDMTVAENIFLGKEKIKSGIFVDYYTMNENAREILKKLYVNIDVKRKMKGLSLAEMQLVEIAKAISADSDVIIMDEPTSAIGEHDVENLFEVIKMLKKRGKGIVYVSHRMKEIFTIANSVTVLRDGKLIDT